MNRRYDGSDERDIEVADLAKKAAQAASDRRKRMRDNPSGITAEDVDENALAALDYELEQLASKAPGFAGAMLFRGPEALALVSLITSLEREALRRAIVRVATSVRREMDLMEPDALGGYINSVTSTTRGAILTIVIGDDLLVVVLEGQSIQLADAWQVIRSRRTLIESALGALIMDQEA